MTEHAEAVTVVYTNWRGETSVRRLILGDTRFGSTEWHPEPTWIIKAFDVDHPAQIWKDFDLLKCNFDRADKVQALVEALTKIANAPSEMTLGENSEVRHVLNSVESIADAALAAFTDGGTRG